MMDPNLYKIHRKNSISIDNQSKIFHYRLFLQVLGRNEVFLEAPVSNELDPILNSCPSIANATMDFSIEAILLPKMIILMRNKGKNLFDLSLH